jgi:hypothetical protein
MVLIGLIGTFWGLVRTLSSGDNEVLLTAMVTVVCLGLLWMGMRIRSQRWFLVFATGGWVVTRGAMVVLFPKFVLTGDERFFHDFVTRLVGAMAQGTISGLSNIYDFPVWLSRAFPFYLPLAAVFGAQDVEAARWLNVLLGAGQVVLLFLITRRLISARAAQFCCGLLLVFPYHWINVLSYDPQIAGTFFLLLAVWLFLKATPGWQVVSLGVALVLAGIQRGGIDLLMVAVMLIRPRRLAVCAAAIFLVWLPLRVGFGQWVESQDAHLLRTHTLGFMTRGWNLDNAGEYLPLYEQLDVALPRPEKQRTLEAVLITEFAREPIRSLLIVAPVKIAKFFALGYASTAEQGLSAGGYSRAERLYQISRSLFAPLILGLCLLGLIRCWQSAALQKRFLVPVLLLVMSCAAIVLIWETSPRYSHPIQFALLILATVGIAGFSKSFEAIRVRPRFVLEFAGSGVAIAGCWLVVSLGIVGVARSASSYQFLDPRAVHVQWGDKTIPVEPLHDYSRSWEGAIQVPAGSTLPATLRLSFPALRSAEWDHLSVSLWLPDAPAGYRVSCGETSVSGRISRVQIPPGGTLSLSVSASGETRSPLRIGIGYALPN